jgi:hypothetical protein
VCLEVLFVWVAYIVSVLGVVLWTGCMCVSTVVHFSTHIPCILKLVINRGM